MTISCFYTSKLAFVPTTLRACLSPSYPHSVHCQLTYKEHDEPSIDPKMENHSPEDDVLAWCLPSIAEEEEENDMEEHFPTVSFDDDDFWMEEPVPERHFCIHENVQHDLCPYPGPYDLNP